MDELDDEELVRRIRDGDHAAFTALSERYAAKVQGRIERRLAPGLRRRVAASDVFQEANLVALQRLADFEDRGEGSFGAWFGQIVELKIQEAVKRHVGTAKRSIGREVTRAQRCATGRLAGHADSPSQLAIGQEFGRAVEAALEQLPPASRQVLDLLQKENLTFDEAAERMGRSREAVRRLYGRALARMEAILELEGGDGGRRRPTR